MPRQPHEQPDSSYPREYAERILNASPGMDSLDDLARRLSAEVPEINEVPVSVRDITQRPVKHSAVWYRGDRQPQRPYLTR